LLWSTEHQNLIPFFCRCKLRITFVHSHHSWLLYSMGRRAKYRTTSEQKICTKPLRLLASTLLHSKPHLWVYSVADIFYKVVAHCVNHKITLPTWDVNTSVLHFWSHYWYSHIDHFVQRSSLSKPLLACQSVMYPISESPPIRTTTFHKLLHSPLIHVNDTTLLDMYHTLNGNQLRHLRDMGTEATWECFQTRRLQGIHQKVVVGSRGQNWAVGAYSCSQKIQGCEKRRFYDLCVEWGAKVIFGMHEELEVRSRGWGHLSCILYGRRVSMAEYKYIQLNTLVW